MTRRHMTLLAAFTLIFGGVAQARHDSHPQQTPEVRGTITAVGDTSITVQPSNGSAEVTLNIIPTTKIEVEGEGDDATTADLLLGMPVEVKYDATTLNALKIEAELPETETKVVGRILSVTFDTTTNSGSVQVDTNNDSVVDLTLVLNAGSEFKLGGLRLTPDQLNLLVGQIAKIEYDTNTLVVSEIEVSGDAIQQVSGTVAAVDTAAGTLTLNTAAGPVTFTILPGTQIRLRGQQIQLGDLLVGDKVSVTFVTSGSPATNSALRVEVAGVSARPQHVEGTITAVDTAAGTITVQGKRGPVTLTVNSSTRLRANGRTLTLADLQAALADGSVKVSAQYIVRGTTNVATKVEANLRSHGRGRH